MRTWDHQLHKFDSLHSRAINSLAFLSSPFFSSHPPPVTPIFCPPPQYKPKAALTGVWITQTYNWLTGRWKYWLCRNCEPTVEKRRRQFYVRRYSLRCKLKTLLKDKIGCILRSSYRWQIRLKGQNPQWIDPSSNYCLRIQRLIQLLPLCRRALILARND